MVRVAEFRSSENSGSPKWGVPGDQDQKVDSETSDTFDGEVRIRYLIGDKWTTIYRPVEEAVADSIAYNMEAAARNRHIGYSQNNGASPRTSFYEELVKAGGDAAKIVNDCNSDCSAGTAAVLKVAGVPVSADMWTGSAPDEFAKTRAMLSIGISKSTNYEQYLMRGDILFRAGHMCIVLDDGASTTPIPLVASGNVWQRLMPGVIAGTELRVIPSGDTRVWAYLPGCEVDDRAWWITCYAGRRGWTSSLYLAPINAVIARASVYVRKFPVATAPDIDVMTKGEELPATQIVYEDPRGVPWYQVVADLNSFGWVSGRYSYLD